MSLSTWFHSPLIKTNVSWVTFFPPGIVWQLVNTLETQETAWVTANATTTTADPSAPPTGIMTATQQETVVSTMAQAGGSMPAWRPTWMDGTTVGATVGWPTASTGGRGTSWQTDGLENATPSRGWTWKRDLRTLWGGPEANMTRLKTSGTTDCNDHVSHSWGTDVRYRVTVWTSLCLEQFLCRLWNLCRRQLIDSRKIY